MKTGFSSAAYHSPGAVAKPMAIPTPTTATTKANSEIADEPVRAGELAGIILVRLPKVDLGDIILVVFLGICAEQHLDPGDQARPVKPDFASVRIQPQQS